MSQKKKTGVLLLNLGTPDAATVPAVRRYLKEFLWDKRVVDLPRWLWWIVLNGFILRVRPRKVAKLYQSIWKDNDSPIRSISKKQKIALGLWFKERDGDQPIIKNAMTYGNPSVKSTLQSLIAENCERIIVLPLFPQYSATSTGAAFDAVAKALMQERNVPELVFIKNYHQHALYVKALTNTIQESWEKNGRGDHLVMSFHGIPQRYFDLGDPYPDQCAETAELVAKALGLDATQWTLAYQSRFGRAEWVKPYLDEVLEALANKQVKSVDVVSPAFAADCLETLEELNVQLKSVYLQAGGQSYRYIPALNERSDHIHLMGSLISNA
ncbi:MAG: ferrochelatase [Pseudomonadales bacterium]|nr:ferrochelatase [Pseudomonadales bacterium]